MHSKKYVQPYKNQFIMDKNDTIIYQDFLNKLNRSTEGTIEALKSSNTQTDNNVYYIFSNTLNEINLIIGNYDIDVALRGDITKIDEKNRLREELKNITQANRAGLNEQLMRIPLYIESFDSIKNMRWGDGLNEEYMRTIDLFKNEMMNLYRPDLFPQINIKTQNKAAIIESVKENLRNIINNRDEILDNINNLNPEVIDIKSNIKQLKEDEIETTGMSSQSNEILVLNNLKKNNNDLLKKIGELKTLFDKDKDKIKSLDKVNHSNLNKDLKHTNKLINDIQLMRETNNVLIMINDKINKIKDKWTELYNQFNGYLKLQTDYIGGLIIKSPIDKLLLSHIFPKSYLNNKMKYKL